MRQVFKWIRIALLIGLGLVLMGAAAVAYWWKDNGRAWLDATVRERIESAVAHATESGYHFHMDSLRTDPYSGDVAITGIRLTCDSSLHDSLLHGVYDYLFNAEAGTISLRGLSIWRAVLKREVKVDTIRVDAPLLHYIIGEHRVGLDAPFQRLQGGGRPLALFAAGAVLVHDARATMEDLSGRLPVLSASGLDITARQMAVLHPPARHHAYVRMGEVDVALDSLSTDLSGGYRLRFGATRLSDARKRGSVQRIVLERTATEPLTERGTELALVVDSLVFGTLDLGSLIADQALRMRSLTVHGAKLTATLDKELPAAAPVPKELPPAALLGLRFPILIDSLLLRDSHVHYHERSDVTGRWAAIRFDRLQAHFTGIHNLHEQREKAPPMQGAIQCVFMDTASLDATYEARLDGSDQFVFTATMGTLPFSHVDTVTTNLLRLSLRSGQVKRMHMEMRGNARRARGYMDMTYTDLVATVAATATPDQRHSMFGSLMDHAMGEEQGGGISDRQKRSFSVERDPDRSMFTYIWHFTRTGLVRGLRPGVMDRVSSLLKKERVERQDRKGER